MADVKISALPLATTPLAGTEVLPIVQSATTDQVSVANLTAGRAVSAASLTLTTTPLAVGSGGTGLTSLTAGYIPFGAGASAFGNDSNLFWDNSNKRLGIGTSSPSANLHSFTTSAAANFRFDGNNFAGGNYYGSSVNTSGVFTGLDSGGGFVINVRDAGYFQVSTSNTPRMTLDASGNLKVGTTATGAKVQIANTPSSQWGVGFDTSIDLANGANYSFSNGSGMIIVTEAGVNGATAIYIVGGGAVALASTTNSTYWDTPTSTPAAGKASVAFNGSNSLYTLYNNQGGSRTFYIALIRTRPNA